MIEIEGAALPVHAANAVTGEVPFWDARTGVLWWLDIQGQRLLGFRPRDGETQVWNLPSMPGLIAGRRAGGLILGLEDGLHHFDPRAGLGARLVAVEADDPRTRINDGKPDPSGRLWFGTMDKTGGGAPIGALYRLDPDGRLHRMRADVRIPNAIAFSADGRRLHFADTPTRTVEAINVDPATGELGASVPLARLSEGLLPDGACVDAAGGLWLAVVEGGRLHRYLPDGTLDATVKLPVSRPTMPILGGADGRTLFITSQRRFLDTARLAAEPLAGDLLAMRVDVPAGPVDLVAL
jgi:sugar lactone lactonase YvrE